MAVTAETEVKEECLPLDVKVGSTEGDKPLKLKLDKKAQDCITGEL